MRIFGFKKMDAFATSKSSGNPAGAIYLNSQNDISVNEMQKIAFELKGFVSEVGYINQIDETTFNLKYYSSEKEVDFCGHATIAIMYDLVKSNKELVNKELIHIITNKGKLIVENRIKSEDAVFITAPCPVFTSPEISKEGIAEALHISPGEVSAEYPVSVVNAGLETLIVPVRTLKTILSLSPQLEELKSFCLKNSIDIITIFTDEVADKSNKYRTRVFAPIFGYLEDPATGSGNSALGYYLLKNKRWDGEFIVLEQNGNFNNPNIIKLVARCDKNKNVRVLFGGGAIVRIKGEYILS